MFKRRKQSRKLNNAGFTLVELLVAMAILAVVSLTVYTFMTTSTNLYGKSSAEATVQTEAQLVANTISNLIVDCEINIRYGEDVTDQVNPPAPEGGEGEVAEAEGGEGEEGEGEEGEGAEEEISLSGETLEIDNSDYQFLIIHDGEAEQLFYLERRAVGDEYEDYDLANAELLADNVTEFGVDLSRVEEDQLVSFIMSYENNGRVYRGNYQVNLRNAVTVNQVVTKPIKDESNVTRVVINPREVYVNIKGKENPQADIMSQTFVASSDAKNVTSRTNLFTWTMDNMNAGAQAMPSGADEEGNPLYNDKSYTITFVGPFNTDGDKVDSEGNLVPVIPSTFNVIASSTIMNKATGKYPSAVATIYYKKVLDLTVTPTRGVIENEMSQKGTATFEAEVSDYNLTTQEKYCDWKLEYKTGNGDYITCPANVATLGSTGTMAYVVLGDNVDETYTFRITATSRYDNEWSGEYEFGVKAVVPTPGQASPSRGVEIDLESFFMGAGAEYLQSDIRNMVELVGVKINNVAEYDVSSSQLFYVTSRKEGDKTKYYMYLDYDSWVYPYGDRALKYYDAPKISMLLTYYYLDSQGNKQLRENYACNWELDPTNLMAGTPSVGSDIVLQKGQSTVVDFSVQGYNISKKNYIGIYFYNDSTSSWENANANEVGMLDLNDYLSVNYTGTLGDRYDLQLVGNYTLSAKGNTAMYPVGPIQMMTTIDPMYRLAASQSANAYVERSSYTYNVYVANVEGTCIYIPGPNEGQWNESDLGSNITFTSPNAVTVKLDAQRDADGKIEKDAKGNIVLYTMTYEGKQYYYHKTYHYWKAMN